MRKQRRLRKEDIGDPSNFVHIQHVGFGPKTTSTSGSFDLGQEDQDTPQDTAGANNYGELGEQSSYTVERRIRGSRSSLIPRHHRSTTTCIFPSENSYTLSRGNNAPFDIRHRESSESPGISSDNKSTLKPTFGSLLNLSFLPLGLGKSSSKSPSIGKTKRMSLLNLTASNLFTNSKAPYEENRESVHMTGYTRRRSFSKPNDENNDNTVTPVSVSPSLQNKIDDQKEKPKVKSPDSTTKPSTPSTRIPLSKLGRSKSSMSEFSKRPKLRLKIAPPPQPPPGPPVKTKSRNIETAEALPSPPPSPIPSPPPSPVPTPSYVEEVSITFRSPKSTVRPRIIPLPSTSSVDSADPASPQYLTPAGGCSPVPNSGDSSLPFLLSPTIPPSSTPFFPTTGRTAPGTPPVWPLQPVWPSTVSIQSKEPTIPEIPSPCKEEMETSDNEYAPVLSIVDSFVSCENASLSLIEQCRKDTDNDDNTEQKGLQSKLSLAVNPSNIHSISSVLQENIEYTHWPSIAEKLFKSIQSNDNVSKSTENECEVYGCLLTKTLELWAEKAGDEAVVGKLMAILQEENHHQATESLHKILQDLKM